MQTEISGRKMSGLYKGRKHPLKLWYFTANTGAWGIRTWILWFSGDPPWGCVAVCLQTPFGENAGIKEADERMSVCWLSPSIPTPCIWFKNSGILKQPVNQSKRQEALLTAAETETLFPTPSVGKRASHEFVSQAELLYISDCYDLALWPQQMGDTSW